MIISILCSNPNHPIVTELSEWSKIISNKGHSVSINYSKNELCGGDILFLVSCSEFIGNEIKDKYTKTLVLHASDLPKGRGWSPYIWGVLNGDSQFVVCLIDAADPIDSGDIYLKTTFFLEGHELLPEIHKKLFDAELFLMSSMIEGFLDIEPIPQGNNTGSYMKKRDPNDSQLDPDKTISEQFNLLRVVDSDRYPAFFNYRGKRYNLKIESYDNDS